jgi:hypothetical protein
VGAFQGLILRIEGVVQRIQPAEKLPGFVPRIVNCRLPLKSARVVSLSICRSLRLGV